MERELSVSICTDKNGRAEIYILDHDSSCSFRVDIPMEVDCNKSDDLARKLGYELLSWVDIDRDTMKRSAS